MADYERSTRALTFATLPDPIRTAVRERADAAQLTLAGEATAYLTHSRRLRKRGIMGRLTGADKDTEHLTALVLGGKDVVVATHGDERGTTVLVARLEDVEIDSLVDRLAAAGSAIDDSGVSITGFPVSVEGTSGRGSFFVGLGPPEGERARTDLEEAVRRAKA